MVRDELRKNSNFISAQCRKQHTKKGDRRPTGGERGREMEIVQNFDRKTRKWKLELMNRRGRILPIRPWYRHPMNALCFAFLSLVTPWEWEKRDMWLVGGIVGIAVWFFLTNLIYSDIVEPVPYGHPWSPVIAILVSAILAAIMMVFVTVGAGEAIGVLVIVALVASEVRRWCWRRLEWQSQSFFHRRDHLDVAYIVFPVGSFLFLVGPQDQATGLHVIGVMLMLIAAQQFFHPFRFRVDSRPSLWVGRMLCAFSLGCVGISRSGNPA